MRSKEALELKKRVLRAEMGFVAGSADTPVDYEVRFHPIRKWRFDVAFPDVKIALEIEGAVWTHGRHTRGAGFLGDMEKYNTATLMGWRILRCTWDDVMEGKARDIMLEVLSCRVTT